MEEINFNDLPKEIKSMIFKINRERERDEFYKLKYSNVLEELKVVHRRYNRPYSSLAFFLQHSVYRYGATSG